MELCVITENDEITHLALKGRLDLLGVNAVDLSFTAHAASRRKPTVVDLSELVYISSMGLRMFITVARTLERHGMKMVLLQPQPLVAEVLQVSGLDKLLLIAQNEASAFELVAG